MDFAKQRDLFFELGPGVKILFDEIPMAHQNRTEEGRGLGGERHH